MPKDKKAFLFYFFMSLIFLDFAQQIKILSKTFPISNINNPIFKITYISNSGGAFGIFENGTLILGILGIIAIICIAIYVYKNLTFKDKLNLFALTIFTAGTLGNAIERITDKFVTDYIKLNFINFPVFNAFDILICTGIALYFIYILKNSKGNNDNNYPETRCKKKN